MDIFCIKLSWPASFAVQNIHLFGKFLHILWTDSTFQRSPHCNKINKTFQHWHLENWKSDMAPFISSLHALDMDLFFTNNYFYLLDAMHSVIHLWAVMIITKNSHC